MSEAADHRFTLEEFFRWQEGSEHRFELVDGRPVAMTGATFGHDRVVVNILTSLRNALRGGGSDCDASTADIGVITGPRTLRRPDVAIYCPPFEDLATKASDPRLVVEVLSPSTRDVDQATKLAEYKEVRGCDYVILVNPTQIDVAVWSRSGSGEWELAEYTSPESVIPLDRLGITLPITAIYERTNAKPALRPRLIWPDDPLPER
jgi:Uma2 family endonuclease